MNKWPCLLLTTLGLAVEGIDMAEAALKAVDPGPYTASTGHFPHWYQDHDDLSLELCQSRAQSPLAPGSYMCTLLPEPGLFDDAQPMVFPNNWPSELFWFMAEAAIPDAGNYGLEVYTAAIEAAFALELPRVGDQQSFARIRIRANIPTPGTYRVTHPYGVETFEVTAAQVADGGGRRAINMTRDIGIGAPGVFSGALDGDVGPFLKGSGAPYPATNPDTGEEELFIGDPNVPSTVTGSPFDTNYVEISGPAGTIRTDLFSVSGKIFDSRAATPVVIERASYRRTSQGMRLEVFANGPANAEFCYRETLELVEGGTRPACLAEMVNDGSGYFFAQNPSPAVLPPFVVVTGTDPSGVTKATSTSREVTDVVKISSARYSWADRSLTIEASSSDEVQIPDLAAQGFGRMTKAGTLQTLRVTDLAQPPAVVTVKSAAGGADTEAVAVVGNAPEEVPNQAPVASDDSASTSFGVPVTLSVLTNDSDADGERDLPLTITGLTQPGDGLGSVALNGSTTVVYTPPPVVNSPLTATFTYRALDVRGEASAPATVTVSVSPNQPPVGIADTGATLGVPLTLNVLTNDSDPEGNVPLTVANLTPPPAGQGTVSTDGTSVTYTPPTNLTAAFSTTFTYQARDVFGALSAPVTVTIQVSPPPAAAENFSVATSEFTLRSNNRVTWSLDGTSSVTVGNSVRVQVTTTSGLVDLGSAVVPVSGRWRMSVTTTGVTPTATPTATLTTSQGTVRTVTLTPR